MKKKDGAENKTESKIVKGIKAVKSDYVLRTFIFSALSFFITIVFAAYNVFLGAAYKTAWNFGIAVYYALLIAIRAYVIFAEKAVYNSDTADEKKKALRKKRYLLQSVLLLFTDLALIAPISMMVLQQKQVNYTEIPAISIAAYTVYKIVISSVNYAKTRKHKNLSVKILKNINFIDALVSVLSLQYILVMTFGEGVEGDMLALCASTSFAIWGLIIVVSILSLVNAVKTMRTEEDAPPPEELVI